MHRICVGISFFLLAGLTGPTPASAQTITDSVTLFWGPAAAAVLLAVAALVLWSQARARDRAIAALRAEIDQLNTVSTAAAEQAVFWKNSTYQGRATPGFEALLGEEISDNAPFEAVLALLSSGDAEALRAAVDSLRRDRAEFQFQCGMADGVRHFAFRGVCAAGGAVDGLCPGPDGVCRQPVPSQY